MAEHDCRSCSFRAKYDNHPKSLLGMIWRWHTNWCPRWQSFMKSLSVEERFKTAKQYNMAKYV